MADDISTAGEPTNTDATGASELDAAAQLVAEAQQKAGPPPSEGADATEPTEPTDVTGQPDRDTPPDDYGKAQRLAQENAAQRKILLSLNIDPDSEAVRQFNEGLITREELLGTARQEPEKPRSANDRFREYKEEVGKRIKSGQNLTNEDFMTLLDIEDERMKESQMLQERSDHEAMVNRCINAASAVIAADPLHRALPEDIQELESQFFVAATDSVWCGATSGDRAKFTPQSYDYYAKKNLEGPYQKLRNSLIEIGRQLERKNPTPKPQPNPTVVPLSTHTGSGPVTPPGPVIKLDNVGDVVKQLAKQNRAVV